MEGDAIPHALQLKGVSDEHQRLLVGMEERGLLRHLGVRFLLLSPEKVIASMHVESFHHQPWGILHGGVSVSLAETVASVGAWLHCVPSEESAVGIEINANHLRSVTSGTLVATGEPIHAGRAVQVWGVQIVVEDSGAVVCTSRCTILRRKVEGETKRPLVPVPPE